MTKNIYRRGAKNAEEAQRSKKLCATSAELRVSAVKNLPAVFTCKPPKYDEAK
jgi:hypothetical protein